MGSNQVDTLQVMAQQYVFNGGHNYSQHGSVSSGGDVYVDLSFLRVGFLGQSGKPALKVISASSRVTWLTVVIGEEASDWRLLNLPFKQVVLVQKQDNRRRPEPLRMAYGVPNGHRVLHLIRVSVFDKTLIVSTQTDEE